MVACTVLRALAPAAGVAETVDHSTNADYWRCGRWPDALKRESQRYWELTEAVDDDSFVWFCPELCNSMPYFDIKLTFDFWFRTGEESGQHYGRWYSRNDHLITSWKGNAEYRSGFAADFQTNREIWPERMVSSIGDCRKKRKLENKVDEDNKCWTGMKHLNHELGAPVFTNGEWETTKQLQSCCDGTTNICLNVQMCFRPTETPRRDDIFITPAYVFYPGSTATAASNTRECRVVRTDGTGTAPSKIETYWTNPPKYQSHSLEWKSLRLQDWQRSPLNAVDEVMSTQGWVDERKGMNQGDLSTKAENWKKYEWMCSNTNCDARTGCATTWKYFEARQYESKCTEVPCRDFRTAPCWQNSYSVAASACAWRKKALTFRADYPYDPDGEWVEMSDMTDADFASSMVVYGNARYIMHYDRNVMEFDVRGFPRSMVEGPSDVWIPAGEGGQASFRLRMKPEYSCEQCVYADQVKGMVPEDRTKRENEVAKCVACHAYEYLVDHQCKACEVHKVRAAERDKCAACPASAPMRRGGNAPDANCTACAVLDYFNGADARGCLRLASVTDGLRVRGLDVIVSGIDKIFGDSEVKEVRPKAYRALAPGVDWWRAVSEVMCASTAEAVGGAAQLSYRRWCGHREIVREGQALLQVGNASEYSLLRTQETTAGYAAISDVCRAGTLRPTTGGLFDLQCTDNRSNAVLDISVVRKGGAEKCTVCAGASYTKACLPTYHPALVNEEAAYFRSDAALSSAGTCQACYPQCLQANHYMSPESLSCMWNGSAQGRVTGVVSALASAGLFYWYKQAPCKLCVDATLSTTHAVQIKQCGNKRTYRTWDALQSTLVSKEDRSIPMTQTCCSKSRDGTACTQSENAVDLDAWIGINCKEASELEDMERVQTTYCPPGWYVDEACATITPDKWVPDCCKRCEACGPGRFKTETYAACSGATFIDTEQNGCETSCLSNSYRKDGRCYRCEQCSTTGTGEHDL